MVVRHSPTRRGRFERMGWLAGLVLIGWTVHPGAEQSASPGATDLKGLARQSLSKLDGSMSIPGLREPVEIIRDKWGVPHIYARNVDDLFFAQGYTMGQDRLWQLEMWRRQREGRLAEILGPRAFDRDRQTRLLMYRGAFDSAEWTSYHPEGKRIFTAYVNGLNAYIAQNADNLPVEFKLTGVKPEPWTAETVLLRTAGFGDAAAELQLARLVARVGPHEANRIRMPDPWDDLKVPEGLDVSLIGDEVVAAMGGRGGGGRGALPKPEIVAPYKAWLNQSAQGDLAEDLIKEPGSNNWAVGGARTATGKPIVSNDPHREVTNPSLRYIVHLNAPGWNVIGAQEAPFVGVALGHNERVAWGLTITGTDQDDVFVEEVNPANQNEVKYNDKWEPLKIVHESIRIKGEAPRAVEYKFSRHGPVFYEDTKNHRAYALRSTMNEPGTGSYLGGLRLDQAKDCKSFLEEALYWKAPTENLVCGDVDGNLTMQGSALTPNRNGWVGRLPVPGAGKFEWNGFRTDLPRLINPAKGYIATANNNVNPPGIWPPVMFKTTTTVPFDRITRVEQVLNGLLQTKKFTIEDSERLQHDYYSLRAAFDQDVFKGWTGKTADVEKARAMVADWDARLLKESAPAAIYTTWRGTVDPKGVEFSRPLDERRSFAEAGLVKAIEKLAGDQGSDWAQWRYGRMHDRDFPHPFVKEFDLPTVERSGGNGAVGADGASYREIMDTANWDRSVVTNVPGQSGQPESPYYSNLLPLWDRGEYFPMVYSRARVDQEAAHRLMLKPPAAARPSAQR
jgi:penicillin G amidase